MYIGYSLMYILHVYRLLIDQFCITEDCLNKFHKRLTKITFVKTIRMSLTYFNISAFQAFRARTYLLSQHTTYRAAFKATGWSHLPPLDLLLSPLGYLSSPLGYFLSPLGYFLSTTIYKVNENYLSTLSTVSSVSPTR